MDFKVDPHELHDIRRGLTKSREQFCAVDLPRLAARLKELTLEVPFPLLQRVEEAKRTSIMLEESVKSTAEAYLLQDAAALIGFAGHLMANTADALDAPDPENSWKKTHLPALERFFGIFESGSKMELVFEYPGERAFFPAACALLAVSRLSVVESQAEKANQLVKEATKIREAAQQQALLSATTEFAGVFERSATGEDLRARWGLGVAGFLIVVGFALTFCIFTGKITGAAQPDSWSALLSRGAFMVLLLTAIVPALQAYRARSHLAALNRHRANVLTVYERLVAAASDAETKTVLLRVAADSIFSAGETGFEKGSAHVPDRGLVDLTQSALTARSGQ